MCGIFAYTGKDEAGPILLEGLTSLEYRGYDSAGIYLPDSGGIKAKGAVTELRGKIPAKFTGKSGIAHLRWATHGEPTEENAHPHKDCTSDVWVVHNGIIENYQELKSVLVKKGHKFLSQTDTEVIAHLIEEHSEKDFLTAVQKTIRQLRGAFALGVIHSDHPETLIAARIGSPLIIGLGKNENFIASDVPAILDRTAKVIYLKDGELALLRKNLVQVYTFAGKSVRPKIDQVSFTVGSVHKEGFAHFMLKEIHEQPNVLTQMFSSRIKGFQIHLEGLQLTDAELKGFDQMMIVACGTAYHAGLVGKYIIEKLAGISVAVDVSSEFRYRSPIITPKTLILAISQSGETADTLAAVKEAKAKGAKIISICNVLGSSLARESDGVLYTHAGPEIGVASTKAYTAQLAMLYLLALKLSRVRKKISRKTSQELIKDLKEIPSLYQRILKHTQSISRIGHDNAHFGCFLFLGRNLNFPSALEGALKLKEISYIPAEGYAAGEMKHGPIALIDEYRAVVCIAVQSDTYEKMISNIEEIRSRRGKIIAIATEGDDSIKERVHEVIYIPSTNPLLTPLLVALPLQLIAYSIATKRGCDVDQPRNLAKSVTVE